MDMDFSSPISGYTVQKWMRDRKLTGAPQTATAVNADHRDDLLLIFNHLDNRRRGKVSLDAIGDALAIVALSEDPDRHARLAESIISCFHAPGRLKLEGGVVDFKEFAAVMSSEERGRTFPTLQDELKSDGLVAATTHFANLFRRDVVVRGTLNRGGADTLMCATFKELFKAEGSAALAGDRVKKLRLHAVARENKNKRALESKRSALARRVLVKRSSSSHTPASGQAKPRPPAVRPPSFTVPRDDYLPPQAAQVGGLQEVADIGGGRLINEEDGLRAVNTERGSKEACLTSVSSPEKTRPSERRERSDSLDKETPSLGDSSAHGNINVKREALRQASAVLGLRYSPAPPRPAAQVAGIVDTFRRRAWWRGRNCNGGAAQDHTRDNGIVAVAGGFVHCPPATVLRLRRRSRQACSVPTRPQQDAQSRNTGLTSSGKVTGEGRRLGDVVVGDSPSDGDATVEKPPPRRLYGRRNFVRLPCWALCDRGIDGPGCKGRRRRQTVSLDSCDEHDVMKHPLSRRDSTATALGEMADTVVEASEEGEVGVGVGAGVGAESQQSVSNFSTAKPTTATTVAGTVQEAAAAAAAAVTVPKGTVVETKRRKPSPIDVDLFPLARWGCPDTVRSKEAGDTREGGGGEAAETAAPAAQTSLLPRRPTISNGKAKSGKGSTGHYTRGGTRGVPPPTPWRLPCVVMCRRRPRPPRGLDDS